MKYFFGYVNVWTPTSQFLGYFEYIVFYLMGSFFSEY